MTLKQRREQLLINSYKPPTKGSTSGHGTVRKPGILGTRREATYNEKLKANQSQNLKDLIKSLKYNVNMTPDSFRKLVKKVEKDTGQKIVFPNGSKEWAVYNANRNPSRWDRAKQGRIQSQYDITKDTETMNFIGGKILKYNESLKDPQEVALDESEAGYEQRLSNLSKIKIKPQELEPKIGPVSDAQRNRERSGENLVNNRTPLNPTGVVPPKSEKAPANIEQQEAWKFLQREGPGGRMTPQKMRAINALDPGGTGNYQNRAVRVYFGDKYKGTE